MRKQIPTDDMIAFSGGGAMMKGRTMLTKAAEQALKALQREQWVERDDLINLAEVDLLDDDLDTRINAAWNIVNELLDAGYDIEYVREAAGDFFRLTRVEAGR